MSSFNVKVHTFEGPLYLLLYLIKKHKLDICDIKISVLLEQYLNYIGEMQAQNLELSSEFLEIAAHLIYIKTSSLLPKKEQSEKLKQELTGRLLKLDSVKTMAIELFKNSRYGKTYSRNKQISGCNLNCNLNLSIDDLIDSYKYLQVKAKRRSPPPKTAFSGIVEHKVTSVVSRVTSILKKLYKAGSIPLNDIFVNTNKDAKVATFLAMLELLKAKRIKFNKDNSYLLFDSK